MIHHTTLHTDPVKLLARFNELQKHDPRGAEVKSAFNAMKEVRDHGSAVEHEMFVEKFGDIAHLASEGIETRIRSAYIATALLEAARHGRMTASTRLHRAAALLEEFTDADY
jgi:hypothetical protein